jgi:hypothetical protein
MSEHLFGFDPDLGYMTCPDTAIKRPAPNFPEKTP